MEKVKPTIQQGGNRTTHTQPHITGAIKAIDQSTKFGFIKTDDGNDLFVMPSSCLGFDGIIPPIGTRVTFLTKIDTKTKKNKAIFVRPEVMEYGRVRRKPTNYPARRPIGS